MKTMTTKSETAFKVYITKYALTVGITEAQAVAIIDNPSMIKVLGSTPGGYISFLHKPHWHETWEEALVQAEKMRIAQINSLKKKLVRLDKMQFKKPVEKE